MSGAGASNASADEAAAARQKQLAQDIEKAREAGWNDRIPFLYESVTGGQAAPDETRDGAPWLSDAVIYQWQDDFGDVGPPNAELEKMLFNDETLNRAGGGIKALTFRVTVEGPDVVNPVRNVSILPILLLSSAHSLLL